MIPQQFIEEVRSRTDIVELVSSYISLKKAGRNFKAVCPFHGEKTPSFVVSPQKQIFHCFGCGEGGGIFQFLTLIEKVTFPEAVEMLGNKLGMVVPYQKSKNAKTKNFLYEVNGEAASFFHNILRESKEFQAVRTYLAKRGIGPETIKKFNIGFAPGHNSLIQHMRKSNFTLEMLERASLVTSARGSFRDLFINRIIFPIFDIRNRVVGFGARTWEDLLNSPKYINSLENIIYSKRDHLYGLNFAKEEIVKEDSIIVVEGYLDMITPFMRGVKNIAASLGTALTSEQIRLVKRYTSCIILVYDSDKAGEAATTRSIDLILENNLKVKIVRLPKGYDPDSLVHKDGKEVFLKSLEEKLDFFDYKLESLKVFHAADSIEGKTNIVKEMLITLNKLNSEIQKYEYIRKLADDLGLKEEIVIAEFRNNFSKTNGFDKKKSLAESYKDKNINLDKEPLSITEKVLLKFMFTNFKAFSIARKNLKWEYFHSHLAQKTVSFLFNSYSAEENGSMQQLLSRTTDKEISSFISRVLMDDDILLDKNLFKKSLIKLHKQAAVGIKKKLKIQIKEFEAKGDKTKVKELMKEYSRINSEVRND
ncbi:MAG: DNA primase [Candidatus Omnitrophica bacterium]|nr:DNA primase [Candidatus Omnitrophota bacterium]